MRSISVVLVGAGVAIVLSLLVLVGVALEQWVLAAGAASALVSATLVIALDSWRRARSLRSFVRAEIRALATRQAQAGAGQPLRLQPPAPAAPAELQPQVVDTVRLLQAQFVGRLDRLQASVESVVEQHRTSAVDEPAGGSESTPDPQ